MAYINGKHTTVNVNVYGEIPETASGTVIYAVSMGLSRDCVVGTDYASELNEFVYPENIKAGDYMIDSDSACWFQYLDLEDGEASLGGYTNRVVCVANPNGKAEGEMIAKSEINSYVDLPENALEGDVYFTKQEHIVSNNGYIDVSSGRNEIDSLGNVGTTSIEIVSMGDVALYHDICQLIDKNGSEGAKIRLYMYHEVVGIEANIYFTATSYSGGYNEGPNMYYYYINGTLDESNTEAYNLDISTNNYTHYELYVYDDSKIIYPVGGYLRFNGKWIKL